MALINPPAWMQAGSYPARTDRLVIASLLGYPGFLVDEATPMRIRQGVKPSYLNQQLKVRAAPTPNMTVIVSGGYAFIDNHDAGGQGTYVCANDGDVILNVQPAGGAGQFRKDCVIASVYDAETAGSASEWRLEVIQGTYAASAGAAVRPSLPPNAQILADLAIAPSQTSVAAANITDIRQFSVAAGGILPVPSASAPNRPHPGQAMYLTDLDVFRYGRLDGSTNTITPDQNIPWITPSVGTGYTTGGTTAGSPGNRNGPIRYRKVFRDGTPYMEWDGGATRVAGAQTANILAGTLPGPYIPYAVRSVSVARNATAITSVANSNSVVHTVKVDFDTAGAVTLIAATAGDVETTWFSLAGVSYPLA
ncbi:hypothetical protein OHB49_28810 [Streptomyces sp. NBC_01717]|uniref:hypothetical protein n=1 Tax=Streptomyces sp. NBC_01717 TaxID=2975918 RepID=UPI002E3198D1|nr:hypothetical protein [Streptomyces sp. NBC_01717]